LEIQKEKEDFIEEIDCAHGFPEAGKKRKDPWLRPSRKRRGREPVWSFQPEGEEEERGRGGK